MAKKKFNRTESLERIERLLAIEEALIEKIRHDYSLSAEQRDELIREVEARADGGDFPDGDDWDADDALGFLVRKLGPKGPPGKSGAAVQPEQSR